MRKTRNRRKTHKKMSSYKRKQLNTRNKKRKTLNKRNTLGLMRGGNQIMGFFDILNISTQNLANMIRGSPLIRSSLPFIQPSSGKLPRV